MQLRTSYDGVEILHRELWRVVQEQAALAGLRERDWFRPTLVARAARAMARARMALDRVRSEGSGAAAATIRRAAAMLDQGDCGAAVLLLCELPQLQFAFASKVCAFMRPESCGVIDSAIAAEYPSLGFQCDGGGFVRTNTRNAKQYERYSTLLQSEARSMNAAGNEFAWRDTDGAECSWRAVDVERALYAGDQPSHIS